LQGSGDISAKVVQLGLKSSLVPRISLVATEQLTEITQILSEIQMSGEQDRRKCTLIKPDGEPDTSAVYKALKLADTAPNGWTKFVWKNKAPPRVEFFAWLLSQSRIQCKVNLVKKIIVDNETCDICNAGPEDTTRIIFGCTNARQFWNAVGITANEDRPIARLKEIQCSDHIPQKHFGVLLCSWHIRKWRNTIAIRKEQMTLTGALSACKLEAYIWGARLKPDDRHIATTWCSILSSAM
jgi:hypothetical protein